jgi:hypothetical protein
MNCSGHEFDVAVFKDSCRESLARHPLDGGPIRKEMFLGQRLRRKFGLQNANLAHVPVRDLKGYRLRPLDNLPFRGPGSNPHPLFPFEFLIKAALSDRHHCREPMFVSGW